MSIAKLAFVGAVSGAAVGIFFRNSALGNSGGLSNEDFASYVAVCGTVGAVCAGVFGGALVAARRISPIAIGAVLGAAAGGTVGASVGVLLAGMAGGTSGAASWVEAADIIGRCTCVAMAAGAAAGAVRAKIAQVVVDFLLPQSVHRE